MKNTDTNFDITERARKSIFIDRSGDWTSFTNGMGSMAEQLGAFNPEFLIFVEIYNRTYAVEQIFDKNKE